MYAPGKSLVKSKKVKSRKVVENSEDEEEEQEDDIDADADGDENDVDTGDGSDDVKPAKLSATQLFWSMDKVGQDYIIIHNQLTQLCRL